MLSKIDAGIVNSTRGEVPRPFTSLYRRISDLEGRPVRLCGTCVTT